jgi:hypothetical protein
MGMVSPHTSSPYLLAGFRISFILPSSPSNGHPRKANHLHFDYWVYTKTANIWLNRFGSWLQYGFSSQNVNLCGSTYRFDVTPTSSRQDIWAELRYGNIPS